MEIEGTIAMGKIHPSFRWRYRRREARIYKKAGRYELPDSASECIWLIFITYRKYVPLHFGRSTALTCLLKSSRRTRMTEIDCHDWKQLAEAARNEEDPQKLMDLIQQLNRALDEHMKMSYPYSSEAAS